jgi:hypothetical protein
MGSPSARKIGPADFGLIQSALTSLVSGLRDNRSKAIFQILDVPAAMRSLRDFDHAYIVEDAFLVVYELTVPWYSDALLLQELLILRLLPGPDFAIVPEFLVQAAQTAGARLVVAGTALATSDRALSRLYRSSGFSEAALTLTKEI